jgi:enoyl-CoA hydratase
MSAQDNDVSSEQDRVSVQRHGSVTTVTLSRPDVRNAVNAATAGQLHAAFLAFNADPEAKVAVFHGAHGHFCAGWDLQAGAALLGLSADAASHMAHALNFEAQDAQPLGPMGPSRLQLSKPVIAAIEGAAVAGGMELALWCDMRVMADDAYFGVYCRRFGVPLIDGGTVRLPRLIGMGHAMDLILTGRKVEAPEALRIGLANRVVQRGHTLAAATALANQLASFPQPTMLADRASAYAQHGLPMQEALYQEWQRGKQCLADGLQGAARFAAGQGKHGQF